LTSATVPEFSLRCRYMWFSFTELMLPRSKHPLAEATLSLTPLKEGPVPLFVFPVSFFLILSPCCAWRARYGGLTRRYVPCQEPGRRVPPEVQEFPITFCPVSPRSIFPPFRRTALYLYQPETPQLQFQAESRSLPFTAALIPHLRESFFVDLYD